MRIKCNVNLEIEIDDDRDIKTAIDSALLEYGIYANHIDFQKINEFEHDPFDNGGESQTYQHCDYFDVIRNISINELQMIIDTKIKFEKFKNEMFNKLVSNNKN